MNKATFLGQLDQLITEGKELTNKSSSIAKYEPLNLDLNLYAKCVVWNLSCRNLLRVYVGERHYFWHCPKIDRIIYIV